MRWWLGRGAGWLVAATVLHAACGGSAEGSLDGSGTGGGATDASPTDASSDGGAGGRLGSGGSGVGNASSAGGSGGSGGGVGGGGGSSGEGGLTGGAAGAAARGGAAGMAASSGAAGVGARGGAAGVGVGGQGGTGTGGSGGSGATAGASGNAGAGGIDCSNVGCSAPPFCSSGCTDPCGCCPCGDGERLDVGGVAYECVGGCWAPVPDGGADAGATDAGANDASVGDAADTGSVPCVEAGDCPSGEWCRPTDSGGPECVPFAQEGDRCGGFVPAWLEQRCAPSLLCADVPFYLPDAPGWCRVPCSTNADCPPNRYCSVGGERISVCRDDGTCFDDQLDCDAPGNDYGHIDCVGYGSCESGGTCSWTCGDERCRNLAGTDFGLCAAVLGWAVIGSSCQSVDGCGARGHPFFFSEAECQAACGL